MKTFEVIAPGRAEVLGNHTDYNDGLVLSIAINAGTTIRGKSTGGKMLRLISEGLGQEWIGDLDALSPLSEPAATWPNYVIGVAQALQDQGKTPGGGEFAISSTIPIGAGLSSSAALEIASGLAFQVTGNFDMDPMQLARAGQSAEHRFAGVKCGLLDQISVLMGKSRHLTFIDCRSLEVRHISLPEGWVFVIIHSGVDHALTGGEYNERREACERAASSLGIGSLREITPGELEARKERMDEKSFRRAMHPVSETSRVAQAVSCLASGKIEGLGKLMFDSHESSKHYFENSCEELDFLVKEAAGHSACIGARLSGGGFGGATINLVKEAEGDRFVSDMQRAYTERYHHKPLILVTGACEGAHSVL